jgi:VCBS repeat-containing protein
MKKQLLILYVCFLIITLVPAFAIQNGNALSGKTDEINKKENSMIDDKNKMSSTTNSVKEHCKILQDTLDQMNDVKWYQFWKWSFLLYDGPEKVNSEARIIDSLSKNLNQSGTDLTQNADSIIKLGLDISNHGLNSSSNISYNTGEAKTNVEDIEANVSAKFKTDYIISSPEDLKNGDIIQYPLSHNNYVYLQFVGMSPSGDNALFLGDTNTAVRLKASELNKVQYKITSNGSIINSNTTITSTTTSLETNYIHDIQRNGLNDYKNTTETEFKDLIDAANNQKSTGTNLLISGGALGVTGLTLAGVASIMFYVWLLSHTICGTILGALTLLTFGAAVTVLLGWELGMSAILFAIGILLDLSIILGLISAVLLTTGGGIYANANSNLQKLDNNKAIFETQCDNIGKDLKTYHDGNPDNFPIVENTTIDVEQNGNFTGTLNATDADGDEVVYNLVNKPVHGNVTVLENGTYIYKPVAGFVGNDNFTVKANDVYGDSNIATIAVVIHPFNHLPVSADINFDIEQNNNLTGQLKSTDTDNNPITYNIVNNTSNGTVTLNNDGSFTYTPADGFTGNDTFTYCATDWKGSGNIATVKINIHPLNHLPVAENMTLRVAENENITCNLLATDGDGDNIFYNIINKPLNGAIILNNNGTFTYIPRKGLVGSDAFTYVATDWQGKSNLGTISIDIYEFNHPPVAQNISIATSKNRPYTGFFRATDIDNNKLTFKVVKNPQHGTLNILKSGRFIYTPTTGFIGNDNFTYYAYDGKAKSDIVTATIKVNKQPIITNANILTNSNNANNQANDAKNSINTKFTPETAQLQDIPEQEQNDQNNITPLNNTQEISSLDKNNPLRYLVTLLNKANYYINTIIKQITQQLTMNF